MQIKEPVKILDVPVHPLTMQEAVSALEESIANGEQAFVVTANAEIIMMCQQDAEYKKINAIIDNFKGNNPHTGHLNYDGGKEYISYFETLFKYAIENMQFNERCYESLEYEIENNIKNIGFKELHDEDKPYCYSEYPDSKIHYLGKVYDKNNLYSIIDLNEEYIFLPQEKEFMEFSNFFDKKARKRKFESFYSTFQIAHIIELLKYDPKNKSNIFLDSYQIYIEKFINLLIATQIYTPYGKSNGIYFYPNYRNKYHEKIKGYDLNETLGIIGAKEDDLYKTYFEICNKLEYLLGSRFAIQLWKNIGWDRKDDCRGPTRLGIEYLQWAEMLKECIQHHLGREIFDVDEIDMSPEDIKNNIPSKETGRSIRGCRNEDFTNEITGEYEFNNHQKRLFYLSNYLNYHNMLIYQH